MLTLRGCLVLLALLGLAWICESHNYKVVIIETAFKKINNKFLNPDDTGVEVESHNKSFNVINGEVAVSNQIPMDSKITVNGYAKQENNEYKLVFTQDAQSFCQYIVTYKGILTLITKFGDFPEECPIRQKTYSIKNGWLDENYLPATLPDGQNWKLTIDIQTNMGENIAFVDVLVRIDR